MTCVMDTLPERKKMPHTVPPWVSDGTIYLITINCIPRERNQLALPAIMPTLDESFRFRQDAGQWWLHLVLLMPDHLHGLLTFSRNVSMRQVVSDWKRFATRHCGIQWQRDFFDHRIRDEASLDEKWHYIRNNPVRKGLVQTPDEWPFQWQYGATR